MAVGQEQDFQAQEIKNICFICCEIFPEQESKFKPDEKSGSISSLFSKKVQHLVIGTLCSLLDLPLRDNTFNFGVKFKETRFCTTCIARIKDLEEILNEWKILENKVSEGRNQIENELRKSVQKSKILIQNEKVNKCRLSVDEFREEIIAEISKKKPWTISSPNSSRNSFTCERCSNSADDHGFFNGGVDIPKKEININGNGVEHLKSPKVKENGYDHANESEVFKVEEENRPEISLEEIESDSDSVELDVVVPGQTEQDDDKEYISLTLEKLVHSNSNNKNRPTVNNDIIYNCPFECNLTFTKNDRLKFLSHTLNDHKTKVQKIIPITRIPDPTPDPEVRDEEKMETESDIKTEEDVTVDAIVTATGSDEAVVEKEEEENYHSEDLQIVEHNCEKCQIKFNNKSLLAKHQSKFHSLDSPSFSGRGRWASAHKCDICNVSCKSAKALRLHKKKHAERVQHRCMICGMRFVDKRTLHAHEVIHVEEQKIFNCEMCRVKFLFGGDLTRHLMTIHGKTTRSEDAEGNNVTMSSDGKYRFIWEGLR